MMQHPYFTDDRFPDRFEPELRQTIEIEKEKEQSERIRRKRSKKVGRFSVKFMFQSSWILSKEAIWPQEKKIEMVPPRLTMGAFLLSIQIKNLIITIKVLFKTLQTPALMEVDICPIYRQNLRQSMGSRKRSKEINRFLFQKSECRV